MPASVASVSFSFAPCVSLCGHLSPFPADGVSHLNGTDYNHVRKVEMEECYNLSPSLIAAISCSSSLEELVVTPLWVSVLSVCLTTPCTQTAFYCNNCPSKPCIYTFFWLHLTGEGPFLSLGGAPMMLYNCLVHTVLLCSLQFSPLQFCILCSLLRN